MRSGSGGREENMLHSSRGQCKDSGGYFGVRLQLHFEKRTV